MSPTHDAIQPVNQTVREETREVFTPRVDLVETPEDLLLYADLPGVRSEDVTLECKGGELHLEAKCSPRHGSLKTIHREYGVGNFQRSFRLGEQVDAERIEAAMMDGVLAVRLPKIEAARPRRIPIKGA